MKNTLLTILTLSIIGCGGAGSPTLTTPLANPIKTPTIIAPKITPEIDTPEEVVTNEETPASSGIDPLENKIYTHTYANNFCNNQAESLECWGDINFTAPHASKLIIGRSAVCFATSTFQNGVTCQSSAGPILMNPYKMSDLQNSHIQNFMNVTVNPSGEICFKVVEWHGNAINAVFNICGYAPTIDGNIQ